MSWLASILVALVTAVAGAFACGYVAALAVDWYHVSSFEGGSGYVIAGIGLLGAVVGLILGLIVSRVVARRAKPGFLKALGLSQLLLLGLVSIAGGAARLLADVPPTIDGEELMLAVEVRWPQGHAGPQAGDPREWSLRLSATSGRTMRVSKMGPLWKEDARQVEGRWVVPGAVEVFTSRGDRVLDLLPEGLSDRGFIVPLPAYPGKDYVQWSEWGPHARAGAPPLPDGVTYRFKVVPRSQPVRRETVGPFEISTIARSFSFVTWGTDPAPYEADAQFQIRYRGRPVVIEYQPDAAAAGDTAPARFDRAKAVAVLPGPTPSLLVHVMSGYNDGHYYLLAADGERLRVEHVATGPPRFDASLLTSDADLFTRAKDLPPLTGRVDRRLFAGSGMFLVGGAVLDTTHLTVRRFSARPKAIVNTDLPPVSLSPDGRSFAQIGFDQQSSDLRVLHVTDTVTGETYVVPIDAAFTRLADIYAVDPAWVAHYFAWERGPDQVDRLVVRKDAKPLPYRGKLSTERDGYREYRLQMAGRPVVEALVEFLKTEFKAEMKTRGDETSGYELRIGGRVVNVTSQEDARVLSVWMERGTDTHLVADIARRFDEALATGKYDALFGT